MREAVRKVLLAGIYNQGVLKPGYPAEVASNFALALVFNNAKGEISNELLGQDLKASAMGIRLVDTAFKRMAGMLPEDSEKKKVINQAR